MTKFLEQTAEYLLKKYGEKLPELCIVLPNRRGGLYLRKYLGKQLNRATWAPAIYSIEDFIINLSGLHLADNTSVLFELFDVHRQVEGKEAQAFDEFISWGQQLIHDFNDIDSYLVDPQQLFQYLNEARVLSVWNLDGRPLTDFEKKYLHFYNSLATYYKHLSEKLLSGHSGYQGLIFREAASKAGSMAEKLKWGKIIFAGFNALTASEEKIIDVLIKAGKAEILWDADEYYVGNEQQEAGDFLRKWLKKWDQPDFKWMGNNFTGSPKKITVIGAPMHIGQAKITGQLLKDLLKEDANPEEIATVLMDEQLLIPLLSSLPGEVKELNITMGLTLDQTPVYGLINDLFRMHENVSRFTKAQTGGISRFYFRDVIKILRHPYISRLARSISSDHAVFLRKKIDEIRQGNRVFLTTEEITGAKEELLNERMGFLEPFFIHWNSAEDALTCLRQVIARQRDCLLSDVAGEEKGETSGSEKVEIEYLYAFSKIICQLSSLVAKYGTISKIRTLHDLFTKTAGLSKVPFYGEPLKGLQIMGMLETRTLDFDNVILLSANEDLLPSGKTSSSFIPYDIRKDFRLPTHHYKNAVYAYHFYRLLQRAKNIILLYNTEADELGGGDKSRFIRQILGELPPVNPGIEITEKILVTPAEKGDAYPSIAIPKLTGILERLLIKAGKGLSPSTLNTYRLCPLKFYFSAIAGLQEQEELEDTIDPQILGQAVHKALQDLYTPFLKSKVTKGMIESMMQKSDAVTDNAFLLKYKSADLTFGKNLLLVRVAKNMVRKFLRSELDFLEDLQNTGITMIVSDVEVPIERHMKIPWKDGELDVRIKGILDRVDRIGDEWRIIDYKTGRVELSKLKLSEWTQLAENPDLTMVFQLLTYASIFEENNRKRSPRIRTGIMPLKKISEGFLEVSFPSDKSDKPDSLITPGSLSDFEAILGNTVMEMFDETVPFSQTDDRKVCENCPFIHFCGR